MKKFMISKYIPNGVTAGEKAPRDINYIFESDYGQVISFYSNNKKFVRNLQSFIKSFSIKKKIAKGDNILFVQWPMYLIKPLKDVDILKIGTKMKIALIHDIDSLRTNPDDIMKQKEEVCKLNSFDVVIAHNHRMKEWLVSQGFKNRIIVLEIFDYLLQNDIKKRERVYNKSIVFAGNLDKSFFLRNLSKYVKCKVFLYGKLTDNWIIDDNQNYMGSVEPEKLCEIIQGDFGLIWDGTRCDMCDGNGGNYMKYNNPHKLSLYIASGLPVITWKKAAIAEFIEENGIGITVESLDEVDLLLNEISCQEYENMVKNVEIIQKRITSGFYTRQAFDSALSLGNQIN